MATAPSPAEPAPISSFGRVTGVFFSPRETFTDIARRPSWLLPIIILTILGLCVAYTMNQKIDWADYIRTQAEKNSRFANLSEDQKQQQLAPQAKFSPIVAYCIGGLVPILATLILGGIYLGAFNVFSGGGLRFNQSMGIVAHGSMPGVVASIIILLTLALRAPGESTPENMLVTHAGTFLSSDAPRWQLALFGSFELFWLWEILLFAIGFSAANPKKITTGKALGIILGIWAIYLVVKVGLTAVFS